MNRIHRISHLGLVNTYLVADDDGLTLIDAGLPGSRRRILATARRLGAPIARIAITHGHTDHVGGLDGLMASLPGIELIAPEREAPLLRGERELRDHEPQDRLRGGYPRIASVPTRLVRDGDQVGSLRVVATPGHTPGHVAFLDERDGTLYGGDVFTTVGGIATSAVVPWRFPLAGTATWSRELELESARMVRGLEPTRLAPGHGRVVEAPAEGMERAIAAAMHRAVASALAG